MAIRTLLVGAGGRGADWVRAVAAAPGFELSGCVDVDPAALERAASLGGVAADRCWARLDVALAHGEFDAAIVSTPADDHLPACEQALTHGLGVLVEKPFTLALADARELVRLADLKRRPLMVAQNYRHLRVFRAARGVIASGAIGRVLAAHWHYYRVPHAMAASLARLPHTVLWGMGIHHLDVLRTLIGGPVDSVSADLFSARPHPALDGASMNVSLRFASGARATYTASYESSGHEYFEGGQEFFGRVVGEHGTLHILHRWLVLCAEGRLPRVVGRGRRAVKEERLLLDQFADAMATGDAKDMSGRDNLETMAIAEACVRSAAERRWIDLRELSHDA